MCVLQTHWCRGIEKSGYDQHGIKRKWRMKCADLLSFPSAYCPVTPQVLLQLRWNHVFLWKSNSVGSWYWELMLSTPCCSCWHSHREMCMCLAGQVLETLNCTEESCWLVVLFVCLFNTCLKKGLLLSFLPMQLETSSVCFGITRYRDSLFQRAEWGRVMRGGALIGRQEHEKRRNGR